MNPRWAEWRVAAATRSSEALTAFARNLWLVLDNGMGRIRAAGAEGAPGGVGSNSFGLQTIKLQLKSEGGGCPPSSPNQAWNRS